MRTSIVALVALSAGITFHSRVLAREIFVSNVSGDDRFNGQGREARPDGGGPLRSITSALRLARQGDEIRVENTGQPYRESLSLVGSRHSGFPLRPFVLSGNGAVIDGSAPVPPRHWENYRGAVFRFQPPRVEFQQLFSGGRPVSRVAATETSKEPPKLDPLQWCLHRGTIYFAVEPQKLPAAYPLSYAAKPAGISLLAVQHVVIQGFTIQGFHLDGVNALNSCRMVRLVGLTCRGSGRSGIAVGGASTVDIDSCLVGNNGYAQLLTLPWSETYLRQSELLSNTAPAWVDQGGKVFLDGKELRGGLDQLVPGPAAGTVAPKPGAK